MIDIKGYEGLYAITEDGQVWGYKRKRFLKPIINKDGYLYVNLSKNGKYKSYRIHKLVAEAFIPNPNNLPQVGHKDEIRNNNEIYNLYWTNQKDNNNYGLHNERSAKAREKAIYCIELDKVFSSQKEAAKELNLSAGNICSCLKGRNNTCGGYHWEYKKEVA